MVIAGDEQPTTLDLSITTFSSPASGLEVSV